MVKYFLSGPHIPVDVDKCQHDPFTRVMKGCHATQLKKYYLIIQVYLHKSCYLHKI